MRHWYLVQTKPGQDQRAEQHLANQGYELLRPMARRRKRHGRRWRTVTEALFPRYLFIHLDDEAENWAPIRSTRGVTGLVRFGMFPTPVPSEIIDGLKSRMEPETGCVDLTGVTDFRAGERVRLTEGPFEGLEAIFLARKAEERVMVLLEVMQRQQRIAVPEQALERA